MSVGFAGLSVWRALIPLFRFRRTLLASLVLGEETWTLFHVDLWKVFLQGTVLVLLVTVCSAGGLALLGLEETEHQH